MALLGLTNTQTSVMHIQEVCTQHATWSTTGLQVETDSGTSEWETWQRRREKSAHRWRNETEEEGRLDSNKICFVLNRNLLGLNQNELFVFSAETVKGEKITS